MKEKKKRPSSRVQRRTNQLENDGHVKDVPPLSDQVGFTTNTVIIFSSLINKPNAKAGEQAQTPRRSGPVPAASPASQFTPLYFKRTFSYLHSHVLHSIRIAKRQHTVGLPTAPFLGEECTLDRKAEETCKRPRGMPSPSPVHLRGQFWVMPALGMVMPAWAQLCRELTLQNPALLLVLLLPPPPRQGEQGGGQEATPPPSKQSSQQRGLRNKTKL